MSSTPESRGKAGRAPAANVFPLRGSHLTRRADLTWREAASYHVRGQGVTGA